jgi:hypothetical protein
LCGVNSFDYLIELQRHAQELAAQPAGWTPWNYRETLARAGVIPLCSAESPSDPEPQSRNVP